MVAHEAHFQPEDHARDHHGLPRLSSLSIPMIDDHSEATGGAIEGQDHRALNESLGGTLHLIAGQVLPGMVVQLRDLTLTVNANNYPSVFGSPVQGSTLLTPVAKLAQRLFSKHEVVKRDVLKNITGTFRPGRVTLVLGEAGSGRTTLMKMLSGRLPESKSMSITGDVRYNNVSRDDVVHHVQRCIGYADSHDDHLAGLTVLETLVFAHACTIGCDAPQWMNDNLSKEDITTMDLVKAFSRDAPHLVIKHLGLENQKDALVGSLSPTDQKRLTIAEMAIGPKSAYFIDESAVSLDADTTIEIVQAMRSIAVGFNRTVVAALHHPTPQAFELFDDVMVLSQGHMIYHGPRSQVLEYFHGLGLDCPPHKDVPSFLLEIGTPHFNGSHKIPGNATTALGLADCFQRSSIFSENLKFMDDLIQEAAKNSLPHPQLFESPKLSFTSELGLLFGRQWTLAKRNKGFIVGKSMLMAFLAVMYGGTFWQLPDNPPTFMFGLAFSCTFLLAMSRSLFLGQFWAVRGVYYKHRRGRYFSSLSYAFASTLVQAPSCLLDALIFGSCLYWMGGYAALGDHFLVFITTLVLSQVCLVAYFFFLSSVVPSLGFVFPAVATSAILFVTFCGFLVIRSSIPDYLVWIYWINPIGWTIRGLAVNQFSSPKFQVCEYKGVDYCTRYGGQTMATYSLAFYNMPNDSAWIFYSWAALLGGYVAFSLLGCIALESNAHDVNIETSETVAIDSHNLVAQKRSYEPDNGTDYDAIETPRLMSHDVSVSVTPSNRLVAIAFRNLEVYDCDQQVLKEATGFGWPGTLTVVLGANDQSVSTLLGALGGRRPVSSGEIELNGVPVDMPVLRRYVGYCDAIDVFPEASTFREALLFSASLRRDPQVHTSEKLSDVDEILDILQLKSVADRIIRGANPEQLKKLGIAVELAAGKSVLILEDRTRGVGSSASKRILACLRRVADSGRTVIFALQQPNLPLHLMDVCDRALVLHHDGGVAFFGHPGQNGRDLMERLQKSRSTASAKILRSVTEAAKEAPRMDPGHLVVSIHEELRILGESSPQLASIESSGAASASGSTQFFQLLKRYALIQWRSPLLNLPRIFVTALLALILGVLLRNVNYSLSRGATTGIGMFYITAIMLGIISFNGYIGFAAGDKALVRRERHAHNSYSVFWYGLANTLAEAPFNAIASLVYVCILFPFTDIDSSYIPYGWLVVWVHMTTQMHMGQFFVYALPVPDAANGVGILLLLMNLLFTGFNPSAYRLHKWLMWLHHAMPAKYTLASLAGHILGHCSTGTERACVVLQQAAPRFAGDTLHEYLNHAYKINGDHAWNYLLILMGIGILFRVLALLMLAKK